MKHKIRKWAEKFLGNPKNMWVLVAAAVALTLAIRIAGSPMPGKEIPVMPYQDFISELEAGHIDKIYYSKNEEYMTVTTFDENTVNMTPEEREDYEYPPEHTWKVKYPGLEGSRAYWLENGATPTMYTADGMLSTMMDIISIALYLGLGLMVLNMVTRGPMAGMGGGQKSLLKTSDIKFSDVIGQDETVDDLKFIVQLMKDPKLGDGVGARIPKGLLLQGPPGTGKTLLAKAVAGEAGVPFIQQSASALIEMYVGVGAKRVRDLFKLARKNAPCIIFLDEIDAVGGKRDKAGNTSENDQTINALLEQMDGFDAREGVFVIAATNRPDELDEALIRPGRFDRQVTVNPPRDYTVREELFRHYLGGLKLDESVDIRSVAKQTPGFTGADIAAVCNEAGIVAAMAGKPAVDAASLEEAIDKKVFQGSRSKKDHYEKDKRVIAVHESGHAAMTWLCGQGISRASIQGTTSGVGGAVIGEDRPSQLMTASEMRQRVMVLYAGRAAEEIAFKDPSTGASNDISEATRLLVQYCDRLGFDEQVGLLDMSVLMQDRLADAKSTAAHVRRISQELYQECLGLLKANFRLVEMLSERLLFEETLPGPEIERLFSSIGRAGGQEG